MIGIKLRLYVSERYDKLYSKCMEDDVMGSFFDFME